MATAKWKAAHQEQMREYRRSYYRRNRQAHIDKASTRRQELSNWHREFKKTLKCSKCPETYWACLDFHHKESKNKDLPIATAIHNGWSKIKILAEIAKCEVLCSNCHRREHHRE